MIDQYLDDLESRIDPAVEEQLLSEWIVFLDRQATAGIFSPRRPAGAPAGIKWPEISINEGLKDPECMALQQLAGCSAVLENGSGAIMDVRTNYGSAILSSVFGAEIFIMADELNTLPTTRSLKGGADAIRRLLDQGVPALTTGFGAKCFDTGRYFAELFKDYPNIAKHVLVYHPDLQGPMDITELLWGSDMFVDMIDEPALVHSLLELVTETYRRFMRQWEEIVPAQDGYAPHWNMLHKGRIMLRDDSAMNLSPDMFEEFIKPYDQKLLSEFGGGAIHFCGRGDHYIHHIADMRGVQAVNMSQPECNDMERIFQNTVDKGIVLIGLQRAAAESAISQGRDLHGLVHCW